MSFRFAGIPSNATLEMVEVEKRSEDRNQPVVICIQLENNSRLQFDKEFTISSTLREVIEKAAPSYNSPVVVYMRSEVFGETLNGTTLVKKV
jgi:tether containing UBX domain for GLUT4